MFVSVWFDTVLCSCSLFVVRCPSYLLLCCVRCSLLLSLFVFVLCVPVRVVCSCCCYSSLIVRVARVRCFPFVVLVMFSCSVLGAICYLALVAFDILARVIVRFHVLALWSCSCSCA